MSKISDHMRHYRWFVHISWLNSASFHCVILLSEYLFTTFSSAIAKVWGLEILCTFRDAVSQNLYCVLTKHRPHVPRKVRTFLQIYSIFPFRLYCPEARTFIVLHERTCICKCLINSSFNPIKSFVDFNKILVDSKGKATIEPSFFR